MVRWRWESGDGGEMWTGKNEGSGNERRGFKVDALASRNARRGFQIIPLPNQVGEWNNYDVPNGYSEVNNDGVSVADLAVSSLLV